MKLFRFMSLGEFQKYGNGEILINKINHNKDRNLATASIGFCFFNYADYKPEKIFHSIIGIANTNICVIFETKRKNVVKSWGIYGRTISEFPFVRETFRATEYYTTEYDNKRFKIIQYAFPDWFSDNWKWNKEEKVNGE